MNDEWPLHHLMLIGRQIALPAAAKEVRVPLISMVEPLEAAVAVVEAGLVVLQGVEAPYCYLIGRRLVTLLCVLVHAIAHLLYNTSGILENEKKTST